MVPASFDESNHVLGRPSNMTAEQCDPVSAWVGLREDGLPVVITCWKLTREEVDELIRTGRVWLSVIGKTMPPVSLTAEKPLKPLT